MPLSLDALKPDKEIWRCTADGNLNVKSAYNLITLASPLQGSNMWKLIWSLKCTQKLKIFLWFILHGSLHTQQLRYYRHIVSHPTCPRCNLEAEDTLHCLRDCPKAHQIWSYFIPHNELDHFFSLDLFEWLQYNIVSRPKSAGHRGRLHTFLSVSWNIWLARNHSIVGGVAPYRDS